ncbi:GntP family permease [[Clostridium] colinum]|uniref:GntP family permease n=1 Tax=[Clostridium] colinum TaxID=36835 RepID=UPI002024CF42|nr:GntP family permease [[Clostridium] colinum]
MEIEITTLGALIGLILAISLIIAKIQPTYSLIIGALVGGIIGGASLVDTVNIMVYGAKDIISSVLRIITSGILAGVLIKTGSAKKIADVIVCKLGDKMAIVAIAISAMILCTVGVFVDITVITVAPIALAIGQKTNINKMSVLLAMVGGGKAGNIISPNPNTISVSENLKVPLTSIIIENIIPAIVGLIVTILLAKFISTRKAESITNKDLSEDIDEKLPSFLMAILGPLVVIILLSLRSILNIAVDPLIALPVGGIVCALVTGNAKNIGEYFNFGLSKVMPVAILLIGTGTIAGVIKASNLQTDFIALLDAANMPILLLAPISGILMAGATASTTAGATIASSTFGNVILDAGIPAVSGGAMMHAGATVIDSLPHGSFFHATAGAVNTNFPNRLKLIPYEVLIGLSITITSIIYYLITK